MTKQFLSLLLLAIVCCMANVAQAGKFSVVAKETAKLLGGKAGQAATRKAAQTAASKVASRAASEVARSSASKASATALRFFGDDVLRAGGKLAGKSATLIDDFGRVSAKLSAQNQRRLMMLAPDLQKSGQTAKALGMFSKGGSADKVMETLWRHRGKIAAGAAVTTLVVHGDDIVQAGSEHIVRPMAETAAKSIAPAIAPALVGPAQVGAYLALGLGFTFVLFLGYKAYRISAPALKVASK